jgi:hypothetical protein
VYGRPSGEDARRDEDARLVASGALLAPLLLYIAFVAQTDGTSAELEVQTRIHTSIDL